MGILNVTPDSFYDGGRHGDLGHAIAHARQMAADGAAIIDVGGESTRPGADAVPEDEELRRVVPVVGALARDGFVVSVDTRRPAVMRAAIAAGAAMVNDVAALREPGAMDAVAGSDVAVCLMHMQGEPRNDAGGAAATATSSQRWPRSSPRGSAPASARGSRVTGSSSIRALASARRWSIISQLMRALPQIAAATGCPVLVGLSRKGVARHDHRTSGRGAAAGEPRRGARGGRARCGDRPRARRARDGRRAQGVARVRARLNPRRHELRR